MSIVHECARSVARRSPRRQAQKKWPQVETLECRALLSGLAFSAAYGISGSGVNISDVANDPLGRTYVTGSYTGSANFGTAVSGYVVAVTNPTSLPETFVVSYSPTGVVNLYDEFRNNATADPLSTSSAASLTYDDSDETVYVVGNFTGTVDFDPMGSHDMETASTDSVTGADASDAYIIGIRTTATLLDYSGLENDSANYGIDGLMTSFTDFVKTQSSTMITVSPSQVTVDSAGDSLYVTGSYTNSDSSDYPKGTITVADKFGHAIPLVPPPATSMNGTEGFSAKFTTNLALNWAVNTWNGSGSALSDAQNVGIAAAPEAGIDYVVGNDVDKNAAFVEVLNDSDGSLELTSGAYSFDHKYSFRDLTLQLNTAASVDDAAGVVADSEGNAYVVGTFSGTLRLPASGSSSDGDLQNITSAGATNAFIISFDDGLNERWGNSFGSSNQVALNDGFGDDGDAVGIDDASTPDIYVSGEDEGPSVYGAYNSTVVTGQNSNNFEAYVIEVSSATGNFIGAAGATGTGASSSEAEYLTVNSDGQVAVTGPVTVPTTMGSQMIDSNDQSFIANLPGTLPTPGPFDLAITMTDNTNPKSVPAGGSTTYTIVVTNNGPTAVIGAAVNDDLPALIDSVAWTAVASPGASLETYGGDDSIVGDDVSLPVNATVTFTLVAQISPGADALYLVNTATVGTTATTPAGVTDSNSANNSATDTETISSAFYPLLKTQPSTPLSAAIAPVFNSEQRVYKGKGKHKKHFGFQLNFSGALKAGTAQNTSNYTVFDSQKGKLTLKLLRVKSATYDPDDFSVTLTVAGFSLVSSTQATIEGLIGADGASISPIKTKL